MKLTGKALEDFVKWKSNNKNISTIEIIDFRHLSSVSKNALIIDWFQSVNIWEDIFYKSYRSTGFKFYKVAVNQAIEKANEIYNLRESKEDEKQLEGNI